MSGHLASRSLALLGICGGLSVLGGCERAEPASADLDPVGQVESAAIVDTITAGTYVIRSVMTNKCIDVASSSTADGAKVQQWDCNGTNAQRFVVTPTSGGYFSIINVNSNKALDIKEASVAANALVHQWSYGGGTNQQFRFVKEVGSEFSIRARHTDMAIDVYWGNTTNGTELVQYPYEQRTNQRWTFDRVDGGGGTGLAAILSESTFNAMFPNRNPFYTYSSLIAAASTFPAFANTGSLETRKREVAAFFANTAHETGNYVYIEEIARGPYCGTWGPPGCNCVAGKQYYGRGPIQLSWNGNYCAAGAALNLPLHTNPDLLAQDANASWRSAFWFWTTQTGAGTMTPHSAMVNGAGFGETIRTINGALECNGGNPGQVQSRIQKYQDIANLLGVSPGGNLGC
ncbi:RICIN domain-containing protein [Myxococcus sp. XM-1-1-1]|uniref:glycoside hydrolase family 19 protein n=1 Tax=Myxococcus sp. XM-1-1-1 TaxID=2874602 RepID=UPI001CBBD613|nr:glycoside hydrolase family 19 protein [Myxococcus sp. XM-1-1-1]MBZ4412497.1 RICIN domain-containing protein [Myxococcus sp. XM-1-1-1]